MKLSTYRISFLLSQVALFIYGLYAGVITIIGMVNRPEETSSEVYIVSFLGFCVGLVFIGCEIIFIIRSFKKGTLLIDQLCFHHDDKKMDKRTLIISSILFALSICFAFYFFLCAIGVNPYYPSNLIFVDFLFNIFLGLMVAIDTLFILIYLYIFREESMFIKIK